MPDTSFNPKVWGRDYYAHFTDEESEAPRGLSYAQVHPGVDGGYQTGLALQKHTREMLR